MRNLLFGSVLGFGLAVALMTVLSSVPSTSPRPHLATPYSRLIADVDEGKVERVIFSGSRLIGTFKDGRVFASYLPYEQIAPTLIDRLVVKGVTVEGRPSAEEVPSLANALINWMPLLIVFALLYLLLWDGIARPVSALIRQIEAFLKATQERSSGSSSQPP